MGLQTNDPSTVPVTDSVSESITDGTIVQNIAQFNEDGQQQQQPQGTTEQIASEVQALFNLAQSNHTINDGQQDQHISQETDSHQEILDIKQELHSDETIELTTVPAESVPMIFQDGEPISLEIFLNQQDLQMKSLQGDLSYVNKCFEIMYKFKSVFDMVVEDYFKTDTHFKYKNVYDDLESDLIAIIEEDEEKYQTLLNNVNIDMLLTEDDQMEFIDGGHLLDGDDSDIGVRINPISVGSDSPVNSSIRKLPGQKTADMPECPACGYRARCRLKLEAHILEHADDPLVVCNHEGCEMPFNIHRMFQHEKDYHPEVTLTCEMCNEMFESKTMLTQHYKLHIKRKEKLHCDMCDYTDIYVGRMDRHKQNVHGIAISKQFKCEYDGCSRVFKDRASYYTHSLIHKDRSLVYKHKCEYDGCNSAFKRRRNLNLHMTKHGAGRKRFTCVVENCKRGYYREKELTRHMELCHNDDLNDNSGYQTIGDSKAKQEFGGEESKKSIVQVDFAHSNATTTSMVTRSVTASSSNENNEENIIYVKTLNDGQNVVNVIPCDGMEVDDENSGQIQAEHVVEVDENDDKRVDMDESNSNHEVLCEGDSPITDECELCLIKFDSESELVSHLKERHHQYTIKAYHCDFHGCTFTTHFRSILGKHKNNQHGGKYKCEVCGKLSKDSGNHNRHRNIHKNVLYRCRYENCEAVYKSWKAYCVHVLTHSNEQPVFKCDFPQCKYVTYYMNTLNVHKLTHSDLRNFFCPYEGCGKGFKRNGDLNKHITHSHKGVKRPQKKRKSMNDSQVLYRCAGANCSFVASDSETLAKHEEEHAGENLETYKFEITSEAEV